MNPKKVIEELRWIVEYLEQYNMDICQQKTIRNAIDLLEKLTWVPMEDRHPKVIARYLVANRSIAPEELGGNSFSVRVMRWGGDGWRYPVHIPKEINNLIVDTVTHWMPLPELPDEVPS